ncbi:hypothetical protein CISG_09696 [Coccidioides immitis RMSCC 3703]|uniref:Uncharacterized protein n=2 Tax=Coccidioides immitis TaxID=5501 RepID=A0A0J8TGV9_COCIT|nr:hypothetical protein CIRG_09790 [Coccidioides immitis RMSCC 2394]KMU72897.1 hypothetical protein CISG_09696 [Coccidioides immitis RMSCC 3703]
MASPLHTGDMQQACNTSLYEVRRSFPPPSHVGVMTQQQAHVRRPTSQASSDQGGLELATSTRVSPFGSVNRTQETL